jgi:3-hydroxymyristoyl/3-hydroxydecanoyl-(acyl carrier protein) dehydratase
MSDFANYDVRRVMAVLPHRYPMLLVDRVQELVVDERISAVKAVTINEGFFQGHFPGRPIMPGVMIVEALAQAAGVLGYGKLWARRLGQAGLFHGNRQCQVPRSGGTGLPADAQPSSSRKSGRRMQIFRTGVDWRSGCR